MATKELRDRVDAQWGQQASAWGQENHDRERKLIYDYVDQDESIMGLVGCTWGPASAFADGAGLIMRQQRLKGVAVVTDLSVHFVAHKGLNKLVTQMPLPSITAVEQAGGVVTVAGAGIHNWKGWGQDDPFEVRDIQDDFGNLGARFAELVQRLQTEPRSTVPLSTVAPSSSGQHFGMSKTERIDAQWQDRSAMAGRMNPRLFSRLLTNVSGANLKKYEGERKKLHEILGEDENIEYWLGGRWGLPNDFRFDSMGGPGRNRTGHEGIAVATDRRVLLLRSGALGSREIELPYDRIDDVEYNDGMRSSGVKFQGSTIALYSFYFDHNNKAGVKGQARRLVDCVRQHLAAPPTTDAN